MRNLKRLAIGGLAVGVGGGAIGAVAIPQSTTTPARTAAPAAAPAAGPQTTPPSAPAARRAVKPAAVDVRHVAAARKAPKGPGYVRVRPTGPVRVAVSVKDPRGGPPWAVREFLAERLAATGPDGRGGPRVIGRNRCVQLGRVHRGRFGWLTADGTFRPVKKTSLTASPMDCLSRRPDLGGRPFADAITTITEPRRPAAEPVQTVVFGLSGSAAREHRLRVDGNATRIQRGRAGAMLAVLGAGTRRSELRLSARYPRRGRIAILPRRDVGARFMPEQIQRPAPGAERQLVAQAPDPEGGLPFGMTATATEDGQFCTSWGGRVVGDRAASIDYSLDIMRDYGGSSSCPGSRAAQRGQRLPDGRTPPPFRLGTSYGGGPGIAPGEDPRPGRIARRSPRGRTILSGTADADVRYLTFATPNDVRTIAPSGPAHAFLIVYAGTFPTGETVVTTTFRDGRTRRDELPYLSP